MEPYKLTAFDLKLALLQRFRFRYGWICCTEFQGADVIADTGTEIIEVETKITASDLYAGERRKGLKHERLAQGRGYRVPNKFFFCVSERLTERAVKWAGELNPAYGVFEFRTTRFLESVGTARVGEHMEYLYQAKRAKSLHANYTLAHREAIARRCSSELAGMMKSSFRQQLNRLMEVSHAAG